MWIRNAWYVAAWSHEVANEGLLARTIMNDPLVLYRIGNGSVVAMEDRCCHRLAPLSLGRREGDDLRCMYHGLKFGPDGRCNEIPGQTTIPAKAVVRGYPVVERGSWVWVWMGEAARADVSQIPETIATTDRDWNIQTGCLDSTRELWARACRNGRPSGPRSHGSSAAFGSSVGSAAVARRIISASQAMSSIPGILTTSWCPDCSFNGPPGSRPAQPNDMTGKRRPKSRYSFAATIKR
jgi:nitrite reductase/ring-hydroxylating ferredoxin subunit